jgi:hypothetical protein
MSTDLHAVGVATPVVQLGAMSLGDCYRLSRESIAKRGFKHFAKVLKRTVRFLYHRSYLRENIDLFFAASPARRRVMAMPAFRSTIYVQQLRESFHRGSTRTSRLHFIQAHFRLLERTHREGVIESMYARALTPFVCRELDSDLCLRIEHAQTNTREGLLQLVLDVDDTRLYKVVFWFSYDEGMPTLCIGTLQGAAGSLDANREFTKKLWGLRPQNMVMIALRCYARAVGVIRIHALPKHRAMSRRVAAETDLDALWKEQGAQPLANSPFLALSLDAPRKDHGEIPARKRGMYRKRYDFLDRFERRFFDYLEATVVKGRVLPLLDATGTLPAARVGENRDAHSEMPLPRRLITSDAVAP